MKEFFGSGGTIARHLSGYEYRAEQVVMAEAVAEAISSNSHLIVEAGTGVGKSFAYLVPAVLSAVEREKPVIVSTNTISLQEQLLRKDIPFLEKVMPVDFKPVLVKGRSNYLCLRRLERVKQHEGELFESDDTGPGLLINWVKETRDGSLSDLKRELPTALWMQVASEKDACLGKNCSHWRECFFQKARRLIYRADILVVNHHLFFSDLALRQAGYSLLPSTDCVIFDEAHSLEMIASEYLGMEMSNFSLRFLLNSLYNPDKGKGFLTTLVRGKEVFDLLRETHHCSEEFFLSVARWLDENNRDVCRIHRPGIFPDKLKSIMCTLYNQLVRLREQAVSEEEEVELTSYMKRCLAIEEELAVFMQQSSAEYVYWAEKTRSRLPRVSLHACPVDVAPLLTEQLFQARRCVVMTSATLAVNNSFDYFKKRTGVSGAKELLVGSPFDYSRQVKLYLADRMPFPAKEAAYREAVISRIKHYLNLTEGKAFVLFTSYRLMNEVYESLTPYFIEHNITAFRQGDGLTRERMLEAFRRDVNSVLFGTDSFWVGVDVQGETLSNVIITKLPFSVPDHPLTEARIEELKRRGEDAFLSYSLPEAVIKLRQGFGRLIRNKSDTGIIAILDSRLLTRPYGQHFLNSLPDCEVIVE